MGKKIVLDTNIFISALGWQGASRAIFNECLKGDLELFLSLEIFEEIERVLNYPKFKFSKVEIEEFLNLILEIGNLINIGVEIELVKEDPSDNKFIECAVSAGAHYIISKDFHLLKLKEFAGIKIISPEEFRNFNK